MQSWVVSEGRGAPSAIPPGCCNPGLLMDLDFGSLRQNWEISLRSQDRQDLVPGIVGKVLSISTYRIPLNIAQVKNLLNNIFPGPPTDRSCGELASCGLG